MHGYISDGSQDNDIGLMHKAVEGYSSSEDSEMEVIEQTAEAKAIKARKQAQRSLKKLQVSEPELESKPHDSDPEQSA